MTFDDLQTYLGDGNVRAFFHVIGRGESFEDLRPEAFTLINGGGQFSDLSRHPFDGIATTQGGKACGFAQFLGTTWARLRQRYDLPDFTPPSQFCGAVALIIERGALGAVMAGDMPTAIAKLAQEWVSLPVIGDVEASRVFAKYGGTAHQEAPQAAPSAPAPEPVTTAAPAPHGAPMGIALALLPLLAQYVPQIMTLIKPNSASTARDAVTAQKVLNIAAQTVGVLAPDGGDATATHVAQTVEKLASDPALVKQVQQAIVTHPDIMPVLEIGTGGIAAARAANAPLPDGKWWSGFFQPVFVFGLILCGMIVMILGNVLGMSWGGSFQSWSSEVRASVISAVIAGALGAVTGYWFGTTQQSGRKDAVIAQQASATPTE